jgi:hypothetical protein
LAGFSPAGDEVCAIKSNEINDRNDNMMKAIFLLDKVFRMVIVFDFLIQWEIF